MLVRAVDVASYQPEDLTAIIAETQSAHVVVRLYLPEERPPQSHSLAQIASAQKAGCTIGGYFWLYAGLDPAKSVRDALALAEKAGITIPVLWIDYEDTPDGEIPSLDELWLALQECWTQGVIGGIYTAAWVWNEYHPQYAEFAHWGVPLFAAQYDGIPDPDVFTPFGGWPKCQGKQYSADGIDLDIFRREVTE